MRSDARQKAGAQRPDSGAVPSISNKVAKLTRADGFVPFYVEPRSGQLWLELPKAGTRMLFSTSLTTGLGSNPVGLDRGESGNCAVARTQPAGGRQLLVFETWGFRSGFRDQPDHVRSVEESFAASTVASLPVIGEDAGRILVNATDLVIRDWLDVPGSLTDAGEGGYGLIKDRSYVYAPAMRAFPRNTELEAALTFEAKERPGPIVSRLAPDGRSFTVRQHITLAELRTPTTGRGSWALG